MGRRSRKPRPGAEPPAAQATVPEAPEAQAPAGAPPAPELSRSERRDAEARANLEPLAPGERTTPVTVAAVVAALLAVSNIVLWAAGLKVSGGQGNTPGVFAFAGVMGLAAWGMWNMRYWAVLGFQALLAVTIVIAALSLMVASKIQAVILCLAIIGLGGWLFWKLVRSLARMQMPSPGD